MACPELKTRSRELLVGGDDCLLNIDTELYRLLDADGRPDPLFPIPDIFRGGSVEDQTCIIVMTTNHIASISRATGALTGLPQRRSTSDT